LKCTFLGTGTSHGVPLLDCVNEQFARCRKGVCERALSDRRFERLRTSALIEHENYRILIDVGPDFKRQMIENQVREIDAVLITHTHADHIMGLPDIRSYASRKKAALPLYSSPASLAQLKKTFSYMFGQTPVLGGGAPHLQLHALTRGQTIGALRVSPIAVEHGTAHEPLGFRIHDLVYIPDVKRIADEEVDKCRGAKVAVLDMLRDYKEHQTHMILPESIELARKIGAEKTYFVHMTCDIHPDEDLHLLDKNMYFATDGQTVDIS